MDTIVSRQIGRSIVFLLEAPAWQEHLSKKILAERNYQLCWRIFSARREVKISDPWRFR